MNFNRITARHDIVAIGGSAGGVEATCQLLGALPHDLPAIVLITQHRPLEPESMLLQVLRRHARMPVECAHPGTELRPKHCYIGHPRRHLMVDRHLRALLMENHFYKVHCVDALFTSLAQHAGARTIGVILSGLLKDGAMGLNAIKEAGGMALVQDPGEAAYDAMPQAAIAQCTSLDLIGSIPELAAAIHKAVMTVSAPTSVS
jgi:two-component system chemotaxis response regulator CheB